MKQKGSSRLKRLLGRKLKKSDTPKKLRKDNPNVDKINKILVALGQLFQPFKELLISIFPSSKKIIKVIDFIGKFIGRVILLIALSIPVIFDFIRGKLFKFIIIFIIIIILINSVLSRLFSSNSYKLMISQAVSEATGYKVDIEGNISVNLLSMSINISNISFSDPKSNYKGLYLYNLSVDNLKLGFSYLYVFLGDLKVKSVKLLVANVTYKSYNLSDNSQLSQQFNILKTNLSNLSNIKMVLPENSINNSSKSDVNANLNFLESLNNIDKGFNPVKKQEYFSDNKLFTEDNDAKYINLKGMFPDKEEPKKEVIVYNNTDWVFLILQGLAKRVQLDYKKLNSIFFHRLNLTLADANGKNFLYLNNLEGQVNKNFSGEKEFKGQGEIFNKSIYFDINENIKDNNSFIINLSYNDPSLKTSDIIIKGNDNENGGILGSITANGIGFSNFISPSVFNVSTLDISKIKFQSTFFYDKSVFSIPDIQLSINNKVDTGSLLFNFSNSSILNIKLNLKVDALDSLFNGFKKVKELNYSDASNFSAFSDMLISWRNSKNNLLNIGIINLDLTIPNTSLNEIPLSKFETSMFLDNENNLYISNLEIMDSDLDIGATGKINLSDKNGVMLIKANGSTNDLCSYSGCAKNLFNLLNAISNNNDNFNLEAKLFLTDNRWVFNGISGNIGDNIINNTNATLLSQNAGTELSISSQFDTLNFDLLQRVYNFNKNSVQLYYEVSNDFTGIPKSLTINLNLYSNNFYYKNLLFKNFEMDGSLVSGGILIHNFQFTTQDNTGSVKGSFNFNNKVSPSLIGNINFSNILLETKDLADIIFNKYNLVGKVVLNGNIYISGDDYYNGINSIGGNFSLVKYERLKINENNNSPGLYMTLSKVYDKGKVIYQIGDLYSNLTINNNSVDFSPVVIRLLDDTKDFRGIFSGSFNILNNILNLNGKMESEKTGIDKFSFSVGGSLKDAEIKTIPEVKTTKN